MSRSSLPGSRRETTTPGDRLLSSGVLYRFEDKHGPTVLVEAPA